MRQVPSAAQSLACGQSHCVALCKEGEVVTWGCGFHGEMAIPAAIAYAATPQIVPLASRLQSHEFVRFVRADMHGSIAVTSQNRVFEWGNGELGEPRAIYAVPAGEGCIVDVTAGKEPLVLVDGTAQSRGNSSPPRGHVRSFEKSRSQSMEW